MIKIRIITTNLRSNRKILVTDIEIMYRSFTLYYVLGSKLSIVSD